MQNSPPNIRWSEGIARLFQPAHSFCRESVAVTRAIQSYFCRGDIGRWGERQALKYIRSYGLQPIESNWRSGKYEADILALDGRTLVVVEVKTRQARHQSSFPAIDAVDRDKYRALQKLALRFERRKAPMLRRLCIREYRIDVIEVYYQTHLLSGHGISEIIHHRGMAPHFLPR